MENINIGIINMIIANKIKNSYLTNESLTESKQYAQNLLVTIKNSPILQLEFEVYNNLNSKYIENESLATRYIDNNIKLFETYTIDELETEHNKLKDFVKTNSLTEGVTIAGEKTVLFNAIDYLIKESLNIPNQINVNKVHESYTTVLNHLMTPKNKVLNVEDIEMVNEEIIEIATNKFNQKYGQLDGDSKKLFQTLIKSTDEEKKSLLETYKAEGLAVLQNLNKENVKENVTRAIKKINEMKYNKENIDNDIIDLYELKRGLE